MNRSNGPNSRILFEVNLQYLMKETHPLAGGCLQEILDMGSGSGNKLGYNSINIVRKNMKKIGRSGVELHEVRSSASLETEDGKARAKPSSNYHSISKNTSTKGTLWSGNKLRSHGFGEGKCNKIFEGTLSSEEKKILKLIDDGEPTKALAKFDPDIIVWMEDQNLIYWNGVKWKLMQSGKAQLAAK